MDQTLADSRRDLALGLGAGSIALLLGLALAAVGALDSVSLLERPAVATVLLAFAIAAGVAGLYDIVALGLTRRGVAHLTAAAGLVLVLLGPYGTPAQAFVVTGAIALLASGAFQVAIVSNLVTVSEEPAVEMEDEESA